MDYSSALQCIVKDEEGGRLIGSRELQVWVITETVSGMSLDSFVVNPLFLQKCILFSPIINSLLLINII